MKTTELLLVELDLKVVGIRKTLERVPEGKNDSTVGQRTKARDEALRDGYW